MRFATYLKILVQGAAVEFFVLQIVYAVQEYKDKPTLSSFSTHSLQSLDKPVDVTVCKTSQFDYDRAPRIGYKYQTDVFSGQIDTGRSLSWNGVHGNMTLNETLHYLYRVETDNAEFSDLKGNVSTMFVLPHGFCKKIELNSNKLHMLLVSIEDFANDESYRITVSDPALTNSFQLGPMSGDEILYETSKGKRYVDYRIKIKETVHGTDGDSCIVYPNKKHKSLSDCVDDYIVKKTEPIFGFGLPFITGLNHIFKPIARLGRHEATIEWIKSIALNSFGGIIYKPETCLRPCTHLSMTSEYIFDAAYDKHSIYIYFDATVEVQTKVLAYDFGSLLVEVGSSLGLWLGLSVVGLFDLIMVFLENLWRKLDMGIFNTFHWLAIHCNFIFQYIFVRNKNHVHQCCDLEKQQPAD